MIRSVLDWLGVSVDMFCCVSHWPVLPLLHCEPRRRSPWFLKSWPPCPAPLQPRSFQSPSWPMLSPQRFPPRLHQSFRKSSRPRPPGAFQRSEEHTSELQSLMRISSAVFCLKHNNSTHLNISSHSYSIHLLFSSTYS